MVIGCALGVATELRMGPARLAASFAPMLGLWPLAALAMVIGCSHHDYWRLTSWLLAAHATFIGCPHHGYWLPTPWLLATLGVATGPRMGPARLAASFAPMLGCPHHGQACSPSGKLCADAWLMIIGCSRHGYWRPTPWLLAAHTMVVGCPRHGYWLPTPWLLAAHTMVIGCALGVVTEPRMEPARLAASFAPVLGLNGGCALGALLGPEGGCAQ